MKYAGPYWIRAKSARRRPQSAGEILERVFTDLNLRERLGDYEIWQVWDEVVGPPVARVTKPRSFARGRLTVLVASAAWHHTLHHQSAGIVERLNNRLGRTLVKELRFREGYIAREPEAAEPGPPRPLTDAERDRVRAGIDAIEDPDLRAAIEAAAASRLRRRTP